jgi:hypothetical protein
MPSAAATPTLAGPSASPLLWRLSDVRRVVLTLALAFALLTRLFGLSASGLAEDELDKLHAADSYRHAEFAVDGEHPALMKLAIFASLRVADAWNAAAARTAIPAIPIETALRLPNALAGAAITLVLYLLTARLFSPGVALMAAWLWAFDLNAMAVNRIAKEDTFALLFLLIAALWYERAKAAYARSPRLAARWFTAAGAAFGVMLASKYLPYLFAIHVVYCRLAAPDPGLNRPDKLPFFGAMAAAFLLGNFPVLWPGNWLTILGFVTEHAIQHSGYLFHGHLWGNAVSDLRHGLPLWFYAAELVTKIPLPILAAIGIGLWRLAVERPRRGRVFVWTFLLMTFGLYSLIPTKFLRYMLPTLAMCDVAAAVGLAWLAARAKVSVVPAKRARAAAAGHLTLPAPGWAWTPVRPFPGLYRNPLGDRAGTTLWFPPDELYDTGLREAVISMAERAPFEARVLTEAPATVGF